MRQRPPSPAAARHPLPLAGKGWGEGHAPAQGPFGGKARSAMGARFRPPGRPKGELIPLGGKARSAMGARQ